MARKRNQGSNWIRKNRRLAIYLRDGSACAYCGRDASMGAVLSLDHIVPCETLPKPDNSSGNLITSCRSCNSAKSDMTVRAWYRILRSRGFETRRMGARIRRLSGKDMRPFLSRANLVLASLDGSEGYANSGELALASSS